MSVAQIIAELPKLAPADLLAIRRKLIEITSHSDDIALCDASAQEDAQLLDKSEARNDE